MVILDMKCILINNNSRIWRNIEKTKMLLFAWFLIFETLMRVVSERMARTLCLAIIGWYASGRVASRSLQNAMYSSGS